MTNYEKARQLVYKGIAYKHSTYKDTGCIFIDLGGRWGGYIFPKNEYVEVTIDNVHVGHGTIDLNRLMVLDASHRPNYNRYIV